MNNSTDGPKTIQCVQKKRDQNVSFCNIFHKTWAILVKFGTLFPK